MSSLAIAFEDLNPVEILREMLSSLTSQLSSEELDRQRREMLSLLEGAGRFFDHCSSCGASLAEGAVARHEDVPLPHRRLSRREDQVMSMILSGKRLKEIAASLGISVKTVTTHRSRLLRKLGIDDNLGLYRYAVRNRLIEA